MDGLETIVPLNISLIRFKGKMLPCSGAGMDIFLNESTSGHQTASVV